MSFQTHPSVIKTLEKVDWKAFDSKAIVKQHYDPNDDFNFDDLKIPKKELKKIGKEASEELKKRRSKEKLNEIMEFLAPSSHKNEIMEEAAGDGWRIMCSLKDENALPVPNYYYYSRMSAGRLRSLYKCEIDERIPDIANGDENGTFSWLKPIIERKI